MNLKGARVLLVVATAASVREAMEIFDRVQPSVLVSDISMPGEDGYGLIRRVRDRAPDAGGTVPAVAGTAFRYEHNRDRCLSAGFQEYLSTPVNPDVLCKTIRSVARAHRATAH